MPQKITAFGFTLLFLIAAIWWFGFNQPSLSNNTPMSNNSNTSPTPNINLNWSEPPTMSIDQNHAYTATITTTKGDLVFKLLPQVAPLAVNNFIFLARHNFYNQTFFHRIISGFMIQGGDPTGTGRGGPGYTFTDEPVNRPYHRGTLAMANAGPDTNGSQFFIVHQDADLPPNYTIFGELTDGFNVLDAIAATPVTWSDSGERSKPLDKVYINQVSISEL